MDAELRESMLRKIPDDRRNTMGLSNVVNAAVSLPYEMCLNVDTLDGLTNGASCIIKSFHLPNSSRSPKDIIWSVPIGQGGVRGGAESENIASQKKKILPFAFVR